MNREDVVAKAAWDNGCSTIAEELAFRKGAQYCEDNPAWRMCDDELPKIDEEVLVACDNGDRNVGYYDDDGYWYVNGIGVVDNIIAWLPLPKFNPKQL